MAMESKEFYHNDRLYRIEKHTGGEIKVFEHLYGKQKELIVNKLSECIRVAQGADFDARVIEYVEDYVAGNNKDDSHTTRTLGEVLFDCLP
jgi:hypothetical protein